MMRGKGKWEPATVIAISKDGPRSYIVNTPEGQCYRRNRRHLKAAPTGVDAQQHYRVNQNYGDWLEDMYETDTSEAEAPAEQGSGSPPPSQLRRSQRIIRKPSRYTDTNY